MAISPTSKKGTNQFMRQGHTSDGIFGDDPGVKSPVKAVDAEPRVLKP